MIYTLDQIRDIVTPVAIKYNIRAVYVFGSYARGTAAESSDIDLLVDTCGSSLSGLQGLGELFCDLEAALCKNIDLVTLSSLEQPTSKPGQIHFRESVQRERVELYEAA